MADLCNPPSVMALEKRPIPYLVFMPLIGYREHHANCFVALRFYASSVHLIRSCEVYGCLSQLRRSVGLEVRVARAAALAAKLWTKGLINAFRY